MKGLCPRGSFMTWILPPCSKSSCLLWDRENDVPAARWHIECRQVSCRLALSYFPRVGAPWIGPLVSGLLLVVMRLKLLAWLPGPGWAHSHVANVLRPLGLSREVAGSIVMPGLSYKLQSPAARTGAGLCQSDSLSWTPRVRVE